MSKRSSKALAIGILLAASAAAQAAGTQAYIAGSSTSGGLSFLNAFSLSDFTQISRNTITAPAGSIQFVSTTAEDSANQIMVWLGAPSTSAAVANGTLSGHIYIDKNNILTETQATSAGGGNTINPGQILANDPAKRYVGVVDQNGWFDVLDYTDGHLLTRVPLGGTPQFGTRDNVSGYAYVGNGANVQQIALQNGAGATSPTLLNGFENASVVTSRTFTNSSGAVIASYLFVADYDAAFDQSTVKVIDVTSISGNTPTINATTTPTILKSITGISGQVTSLYLNQAATKLYVAAKTKATQPVNNVYVSQVTLGSSAPTASGTTPTVIPGLQLSNVGAIMGDPNLYVVDGGPANPKIMEINTQSDTLCTSAIASSNPRAFGNFFNEFNIMGSGNSAELQYAADGSPCTSNTNTNINTNSGGGGAFGLASLLGIGSLAAGLRFMRRKKA